MNPNPDKNLVLELIQDMQIRLRDMNDFYESIHYKTIIRIFQEGFEIEYSQS